MAKSKMTAAAYAALERELAEARAFQAETADLLRIAKRPATDPQQLIKATVDACHRLFTADNAGMWLVRDDGKIQLSAHSGSLYSCLGSSGLSTLAPIEITAAGVAMRGGQAPRYHRL